MSIGVKEQVHAQFKAFTGTATTDEAVDDVFAQVEKFVGERQVAPKSIGVEYLEGAGRLVFTLGYRSDEPPYGVRITRQSLGKVDSLDDLSGLEHRMAAAASGLANVICHELFVKTDGEFVMVFMTAAA
ncbi:MAG: hypothetical protein ABW277_07030 [Longimicrobiaceae bacterium]